jgi:hypothetical protein
MGIKLTLLLMSFPLFCSGAGMQMVWHFNVPETNAVSDEVAATTVARATGFVGDITSPSATNFAIVPNPWNLPTAEWSVESETTTNGGNMLAVSLDVEADSNLRAKFGSVSSTYPVISVGFYFRSTATNTTLAAFPHETIYVNGVDTSTTPLFTVKTNMVYWQTHGLSNGVTVSGSPITGIPIGATNWITARMTETNMLLNVYEANTMRLYGSSEIGVVCQAGYYYMQFNTWDIPNLETGQTNYYDSLLVSTNGEFPLLPGLELDRVYVQMLIDAASSGDTISLAAGSVNWTTNVLIDRKDITLLGHMDGTWITNTQTGELGLGKQVAIYVNATTNGMTRISQLNFEAPGGNCIFVGGDKWGLFRVDDCIFHHVLGACVDVGQLIAGLAVSNVLVDCAGTIHTYGSQSMNESWVDDLTLGTTNMMVVEGNYIHYSFSYPTGLVSLPSTIAVTSQGLGGRTCWRHNTITNDTGMWTRFFDCHGNQKPVDVATQPTISGITNSHRSTRQVEIYRNMVVTTTSGTLRLTDWRGGTIVCWSNTFVGSGANGTFYAREEDAPYDRNFCEEYPGMDQHWIWSWGNTSQGSEITSLSFADAGDAPFLTNDVNVFWSPKEDYTPLAYPHPLLGGSPSVARKTLGAGTYGVGTY